MTSLFDRAVLEAAINIAIDHPEKVSELLKANGTALEDVGMIEQYRDLLLQLQESHTKGERIDREILASRLAESSVRFKNRDDWIGVLQSFQGRGTLDGFSLFIDRLGSLRFRRRLALIGQEAQDGYKDADLIERLEIAQADLLVSGAADPLPCFDFSKEPPQVPEPLVGDEKQQVVIPGEKTAIASDSGVGKTQFLIALALGIASGREAMGYPCRPRPVLYISSDGDPSIEMKIRRQWAGMSGRPDELAALPLHAWADDGFCLEDEASFGSLRRTLERVGAAEKAAVLILESLATNVRNTELDDQASVRQYVNKYLGALQVAFAGLSEIVSCHLRKPQHGGANDLGTRVAGSIQIRAAFDSIIGLTLAGRDAFTVSRIKRSRSGGDFEGFRVQIVGDRQGPLSLRNEGPVNVGQEELRGAARAVMDFMRRAGGGQKMLKEIVASVHGFKKRAVEKACKKLFEAEKPLLVRISNKPAAYALAPDHGDPNNEGLD